jgi:hypothetical protein
VIINEYAWLWLYPDGTPSPLPFIGETYQALAPNSTPEERLELQFYLQGAMTEYWRAHRNAAGVLYFAYLNSFRRAAAGSPGTYVPDYWVDIDALELDPRFEDYLSEAFKPLGVYINLWHRTLKATSSHAFDVMLVNDDHQPVEGRLRLSLHAPDGSELGAKETHFLLTAAGQHTYRMTLPIPGVKGEYLLKATAYPEGERHQGPTVSRRMFLVKEMDQ